jgi:hypothetical protein
MSETGTNGGGKLAEALSKAQSAFPKVAKSRTAKIESRREGARSFSYKYADFASILEAITPALSKNGLAISQFTRVAARDDVRLVTRLMHASGEILEAEYPLPLLDDPKAMGSLLTYHKRYGVCGIVAIAPDEDDDGTSAQDAQSDDPPKRNAPKPKPDPENQRINEEQRKKLFSFLDDHGLSHQALRGVLKGELRVDSTQDVKVGDLPKLTKALAGLAEENAKAVDEVFPKGAEGQP